MQGKRSTRQSYLLLVPVRLGLALALLAAALGVQPTPVARAATITVNSTLDDTTAGDGNCTLREAINNANADADTTGGDCAAGTGNDTITLGPYTHSLTITGVSGENNNATGDLDILASGGDLTINGVGAGSTIINGLGIIVGTDRVFHVDPTGAGGITVSISGVTVQNGYTFSNGGGIYNGGSNTVNITNSTLSENRAAIAGATGGGGGIYNAGGGIVNITNSTLSENRAYCVVGSCIARGGGVYNDSGGSVNITGGTVYSNTATTVGDPGSLALGGGIYNVGTMTVDGCTISRNTADYGGGIHNSGALNVQNDSTIGEASAANQATLNGGGIYNVGTATMDSSTVSANVANGYGGGICNWTTLTVTNSTIGGIGAANQALGGGGIHNWGTTTIDASTIRANTATGRGGGMCNAVGGIMTVGGCTVSANTADHGGGIYNGSDGTVAVTDSTLYDNEASDDGGGIYNEDGAVTLNDSTASDNTSGDDGGGIYSAGDGGGATLTLDGCTISGNTANSSDYVGGGGIYLYYSSAALTNTTISGNAATTTHGGGIGTLSDEARTIDLVHCTIASNTAGTNGGGMFLESTFTVNVRNTIVAGNGADGSAPDIYGTINSQDYNLIQDTTGATINGTTMHNVTGEDPQLGALADNGGDTQTHALLASSPAIDAIPVVSCPVPTDQRGVARPQRSACDIGAYEAEARVYLPLVVRNG